jgi:hypothetical protein
MAKVMVLADLHRDHWDKIGRDPFEGCRDLFLGLEAIILAGDLTGRPFQRWAMAVRHIRDVAGGTTPTHVLPGNHEMSRVPFAEEGRLANLAASMGLDYAQKKVIVYGRTRFLCASLWSDFELDARPRGPRKWILAPMTTDQLITVPRPANSGHGRINREDIIAAHRDHRAWLEQELARPWDGQTVMVTHHAPHFDVLRGDMPWAGAYASDLQDIFTGPNAPDKALYGHSHDAVDMTVGRTQLQNISLGYPYQLRTPEQVRERIARAIFEVGGVGAGPRLEAAL